MQHRMKCNNENKTDHTKDICNGVENGGEITMRHLKTKLTDVSEQHSIDKVLFNDSTDVCR